MVSPAANSHRYVTDASSGAFGLVEDGGSTMEI
jgi:hypothetical protein